MALNLILNEAKAELKPRITVFGVGGAGGNAVNNMIDQSLEGVEFVVANTDAQALQQSKAKSRIQMGLKVTEGLGAGARPQIGAAAAEETIEEIVDYLAGAHMCFITAGMGGGTGTGAAPIIAQAARELGVLTVGVVTKPFQFEGHKRMRQAEEGIEALQKVVDTLIIIPNQNLFRLANEKTTFTEAFAMADDVLYQGVKGVTDLMVRPGLINLDFADVRAVMDEMGKAMMGTGEAAGEDRAVKAAEKAIANPLLDEISLNGAKGVLINITGGYDMTLFELDEAANIIRDKVDPDANIIVGSTLDPSMEGTIRVSVVATGIDMNQQTRTEVPARRTMSAPLSGQQTAAQPAPQPAPQQTPLTVQVSPAPQAPMQLSPAAHQQQPAQHYRPAAAQAPQGYATQQAQPQPAPQAYAPQAYQPQPPAPQGYAPQPQPQPAQPQLFDAPQQPQQPRYDDMPAPAYRPQQPAQPMMAQPEDPAEGFMAPRPRPAGTPSPEALARLQAAVSKAPPAGMAAPRAPAPAPQPEPQKSRFGIGSLINRMAGGQSEPDRGAQHAGRSQPPVTAYDDEQDHGGAGGSEADRIEIPAFLRRQAN